MKNPFNFTDRMPGETEEELMKRREKAVKEFEPKAATGKFIDERLKIGTTADNQTGFKCIDCGRVFTDEEPTTLNVDDWLGIYEDYGPVCKACEKEIRDGDYESIASW